MTDPTDPLDPADPLEALASAHLDGDTTEAEAARVAGDPELAARVAALAAVRTALRADPGPVDAARREQSILAALAAFDQDDAAGAASDPTARRHHPVAARIPRRGISRRQLQLVGAAAVAVLLALAVPLLARLGSDRSDDLATSGLDESSTAVDQRASTEDAAGGAHADAPRSAEAYATSGELGSFDDLAALTVAVRSAIAAAGVVPPPTSTPTPTAPAVGSSEGDSDTDTAADTAAADCGTAPGEAGPTVLSAVAALDGRPVLVSVHERPTGAQELVVVDAADCSVVSTTAL